MAAAAAVEAQARAAAPEAPLPPPAAAPTATVPLPPADIVEACRRTLLAREAETDAPPAAAVPARMRQYALAWMDS